jgi:hypothetical protein
VFNLLQAALRRSTRSPGRTSGSYLAPPPPPWQSSPGRGRSGGGLRSNAAPIRLLSAPPNARRPAEAAELWHLFWARYFVRRMFARKSSSPGVGCTRTIIPRLTCRSLGLLPGWSSQTVSSMATQIGSDVILGATLSGKGCLGDPRPFSSRKWLRRHPPKARPCVRIPHSADSTEDHFIARPLYAFLPFIIHPEGNASSAFHLYPFAVSSSRFVHAVCRRLARSYIRGKAEAECT